MSSPNTTATLQNAFYISINLQDILYGIELVLYFKIVRVVLARRGKRERRDIICLLFSTVVLLLITIWVAMSAVFGEEMWIIQSDYPGGASAFWVQNESVWYLNVERAAVSLLQLMTDGLLILRCRALYNNTCIIVPCIIWFAALVLSLLLNWALNSQGSFLNSTATTEFVRAYYAVCILLNTTLTSTICYRLIRHGKLVQAELGRQYSSLYFAIVEIVVQSALPFTLCGIALLITLGTNSQTSIAFSAVYFMMMSISPQLLILRVLGGGFEQDTSEFTSTRSNVKFQPWSREREDSDRERALSLQPLSEVYFVGDSTNDSASTQPSRMVVSP